MKCTVQLECCFSVFTLVGEYQLMLLELRLWLLNNIYQVSIKW